MTGQDNRRPGQPGAHFPGGRRSVFSDYARHLREEREQMEAEARMKAAACTTTGDPLLNPPPPKDRNTITSLGEPIPEAREPLPAPQKPELKYSDHPDAPEWAKHPSQRKPTPPKPEEEPFRPSVEWFEELLWKDTSEDVRVYAIMDGYWASGLYGRLRSSPDLSWAHMFQGDVALNNIQDAPFIITLKRGHKLLRWLIEEGWGDGWGMYFTASTKAALDRYGRTTRLPPDMAPSNEERVQLCNLTEGMEDPLWLMRRHFRRFSDVEFEDDARVVDFRYYDPATLRTYLPSCNNYELRRFVGPVRHFYAEGYREVESLNQPHWIYRFAAWPDEKAPLDRQLDRSDPAMVFEGHYYDALEKRTHSVPRSPVSQGKPEREQTFYPMIRSGQYQKFTASQQANFIEKLTSALSALITAMGQRADRKRLTDFSERQTNIAKAYSLETEKELMAFATCALIYGEGFESRIREAHQTLGLHRKGARTTAQALNDLADAALARTKAHG